MASVISSPPFEKQQSGGGLAAAARGDESDYPVTVGLMRQTASKDGYQCQGETAGQLGNQTGDTFWEAAALIVRQCFDILRPGGHAIWVVKDYVKAKKVVPFCSNWQRLCESIGFRTVCTHRAMLVKTLQDDANLFGAPVKRTKERKSFFRRLAEKKGSPRIDFEMVICMAKPLDGMGGQRVRL